QVSAFGVTMRWPASSPITLGGLAQWCQAGYSLEIYPGDPVTNGPWKYATIAGFGFPSLQNACPERIWVQDEWIKVFAIGVNNLEGCTEVSYVLDAFTAMTNRNLYIQLDGAEDIPQSYEPTP